MFTIWIKYTFPVDSHIFLIWEILYAISGNRNRVYRMEICRSATELKTLIFLYINFIIFK